MDVAPTTLAAACSQDVVVFCSEVLQDEVVPSVNDKCSRGNLDHQIRARSPVTVRPAAVLATPGHEGKAYDITGPELLGVRQIAAAASDVTGKPITVVQGGSETRPGFGRPEMAFTTTHFEDLTGRRPTSVRELFQANKATLLTPPPPR